VAPGRLDSVVRLRDVQITDNELRGTLVSLTNDELRDVRSGWPTCSCGGTSAAPGIDDVSRTEEFIVRGPIPPRGAVAFTAPRTPPPLRSDGDYRTSVEGHGGHAPASERGSGAVTLETTPLGSAGSPPPVGTPGTATAATRRKPAAGRHPARTVDDPDVPAPATPARHGGSLGARQRVSASASARGREGLFGHHRLLGTDHQTGVDLAVDRGANERRIQRQDLADPLRSERPLAVVAAGTSGRPRGSGGSRQPRALHFV
jgi:hypothetical protein